eukprot:gene11301-11451_t
MGAAHYLRSFAYGFSSHITNNVFHLDGQKLLFLSGQHFTVFSPEDGKAAFISTHPSVKAIHGMRLSSNKKYLAVVEQTYADERQQVSIYNVPAEKRVRTLLLEQQHTRASTVAALGFSGDARLLLVAAGEPDYAVLLWRWQSSKLMLVIIPDMEVSCAAINPWNDNYLAVAAPRSARSYHLSLSAAAAKGSSLLTLDALADEAESITCLVYLVGGSVVIGTSTGKAIVCCDAGPLCTLNINELLFSTSSSLNCAGGGLHVFAKQQLDLAAPTGSGNMAAKQRSSLPGSSSSSAKSSVQAMVQRGRGFMVAGSLGDVYMFEPPTTSAKSKIDSQESYTLSRRFSYAALNGLDINKHLCAASGSGPSTVRVTGLSVSVTDEHLVLTTGCGKMLLLNIPAAMAAMDETADRPANAPAAAVLDGSMRQAGQVALQLAEGCTADPCAADGTALDAADLNPCGWQVVCAGFAAAGIVGLDATLHLPLLLVVSADRWARVWDWVRHTCLAASCLEDDCPLCCALHPSGLMAAIGGGQGLRIYQVLRGELLPMVDLPVAKCSVVKYSHGGAVLAAVGRSNAIVLYPAYFGGAAGASGSSAVSSLVAGGQHMLSATKSSGARPSLAPGSAAVYAAGTEGACVMRPLHVLKAHVSTVTDFVFSGDDQRLVSCGAGGAVYFWDLATGSRLMELEYVDKKCVYYALCYSDRHAGVIARTTDGRLQHIQDGRLAFEVSGLGCDSSPMALTGDGRVLLAATSRGSIISVGWPKDPASSEQLLPSVGFNTAAAGNVADPNQQRQMAEDQAPPAVEAAAHAGKHNRLRVHIELGEVDGAASSMAGGKVPGATGFCGAGSPGSPCARASMYGSAAGTPTSSSKAGSTRMSAFNKGKLQHLQLPELLATDASMPGSPCGIGWSAAGSPITQSAFTASAAGVGASSGAAAAGCGTGMMEHRLHGARVTAMKILHTAGAVFSASADGLVMVSKMTLVLDGILTEPPAIALPPSGMATGSAATAATLAPAGSSNMTAAMMASGLGSWTAGAVPGLPPPVVLVDEGVLLSLKDRFKLMSVQMVTVQKEAEYQVLRQTQALRESLAASDTQAAALTRQVTDLKTALVQSEAEGAAVQQQVMRDLEALHASAAEELEGLYEARLALEAEKLKQMSAAKDDLELHFKEEIKRRQDAAEEQLTQVHHMYRQMLAAQAAKADGAAAAAAEEAAVWQEVLMQTEEDLEEQAERDGDRLAAARHEAGEAEMKLKAEINILLRSNNKLKAEKAADTQRMNELGRSAAGLQQQLMDAAAVADKLRAELAERDGVITDNYSTIQGLRRRVQELETHKFVLTYKAEAAAAELQPKEEQLLSLQGTLQGQDQELLAARSSLLAAQRGVDEKSHAIATLKKEHWEAKQRITKQAALLDAVAHDVFNVLQQPDERRAGGQSARQHALEQLVVKYCTSRGGGPRSSAQVEEELGAHIAACEKKSDLLEHQLRQALASKKLDSRRLMAQNTSLLADLADLQHTNHSLAQQLATASRQVAEFAGSQAAATSMAVSAATELVTEAAVATQCGQSVDVSVGASASAGHGAAAAAQCHLTSSAAAIITNCPPAEKVAACAASELAKQ